MHKAHKAIHCNLHCEVVFVVCGGGGGGSVSIRVGVYM